MDWGSVSERTQFGRGSEGVLGGPRLAIGATIWAWRLGRGHRAAGSSPLSSDCTAVHVLLCIPSLMECDTGRILISHK